MNVQYNIGYMNVDKLDSSSLTIGVVSHESEQTDSEKSPKRKKKPSILPKQPQYSDLTTI